MPLFIYLAFDNMLLVLTISFEIVVMRPTFKLVWSAIQKCPSSHKISSSKASNKRRGEPSWEQGVALTFAGVTTTPTTSLRLASGVPRSRTPSTSHADDDDVAVLSALPVRAALVRPTTSWSGSSWAFPLLSQ